MLADWVRQHEINVVICDFNPLRVPLEWVERVLNQLPDDVLFAQVDAHNIVPCWSASPKQETSARTFRKKVNDRLHEFLTEFPPVEHHPHSAEFASEIVDWDAMLVSRDADPTVGPVSWAEASYENALCVLAEFSNKVPLYHKLRNKPTENVVSNLSPWLHFGQISAQRVALYIKSLEFSYPEGVAAFLEELIVRRELADNFCFYNSCYDKPEGASLWAVQTLKKHDGDPRECIYSLEQLEGGKTSDTLWNAAQKQLVNYGKIHGYMRMYWAKRILEWSPTAAVALKRAIYMNDHYGLDGRDPNGYVGCMWSIYGVHDRGFGERPVFGKIRCMTNKGCRQKFNVDLYIQMINKLT